MYNVMQNATKTRATTATKTWAKTPTLKLAHKAWEQQTLILEQNKNRGLEVGLLQRKIGRTEERIDGVRIEM